MFIIFSSKSTYQAKTFPRRIFWFRRKANLLWFFLSLRNLPPFCFTIQVDLDEDYLVTTTNQHIIIVREEISLNLPEQQDDTVEGNGDRALCSLETRRYQKRVWFWRSLVRVCYWIKRTGRRNSASVVGGHFQTLKVYIYCYLYYR